MGNPTMAGAVDIMSDLKAITLGLPMSDSRIGEEVEGPDGTTYRLLKFVGRGAFGEVFVALYLNRFFRTGL